LIDDQSGEASAQFVHTPQQGAEKSHRTVIARRHNAEAIQLVSPNRRQSWPKPDEKLDCVAALAMAESAACFSAAC
jgi:hypothetical protein